ncbi:MAG: DUF6048 family protein [Muribaculaceae bacterium]|nr:DUF6048 family protein [Muribaculaceae bacterium]
MKGGIFKILLLFIALLGITAPAVAQRRVTPVEPTTPGTPVNPAKSKDTPADRTHVVERQDAAGNTILVDTLSGREWVDSTAINRVPKMIFPLLHAVSVGVNIWDPVMRMLGQHYGLIDFYGELSLHNRYKPVVELGLGMCNETPDGMNFTYKSKLAPYFKVGINYNIFYNSNPDYQLLFGLRYGLSFFSYEVTDITSTNDYWGSEPAFSIPSQSTNAGYFEICAGIKVKIVKNLSMGWTFRYHTIVHEGQTPMGQPMYIPGYGKRGNSLTGSFSIIYTIPLNRTRHKAVITEGDDS